MMEVSSVRMPTVLANSNRNSISRNSTSPGELFHRKADLASPLLLVAVIALSTSSTVAQAQPAIAQTTFCDVLTAHPDDPNRVASPVMWNQRDPMRAVPACEAAIQQDPNNPRLRFQLGLAQDSARNFTESFSHYTQAANRGYVAAAFALGWAYGNGEGTTKDDAQAIRWYRWAAERGHQAAQNTLGFMYENARGMPRDYAEAAIWYSRAAAQGRSVSIYNLGRLVAAGRGVPQDATRAVELLRNAVRLDRPDAALFLALMAERGEAPSVSRREMTDLLAYAEAAGDQPDRARRSLDQLSARGGALDVQQARQAAVARVNAKREQDETATAQRERQIALFEQQMQATVSQKAPGPSTSAQQSATIQLEEERIRRQRKEAEQELERLTALRQELEAQLRATRETQAAAAANAPPVSSSPPPNPGTQASALAAARGAPTPFSDEFVTVNGAVGCRSSEPLVARASIFKDQHEGKEFAWTGRVRAAFPSMIELDMGSNRADVAVALIAGQEALSPQPGQMVKVRFALTQMGTCTAPFRGQRGVILSIDGNNLR
ncbi:tetratricopeptide repeat protein [Belnapia moabensis]|uniref:tetratricopeptide repeat protein n=1 Tax=Belnapia moabensis TaxID=365533 RepID=UPI000A00CD11|nr:tetratricopeptide repeat protein [Belnapia moabensis]